MDSDTKATDYDLIAAKKAAYKRLASRGGRNLLAKELGITPGAISQWPKVPAERLRDVCRITGAQPHEVRPDLFDPPGDERAA